VNVVPSDLPHLEKVDSHSGTIDLRFISLSKSFCSDRVMASDTFPLRAPLKSFVIQSASWKPLVRSSLFRVSWPGIRDSPMNLLTNGSMNN
jgi:hypothetical protein